MKKAFPYISLASVALFFVFITYRLFLNAPPVWPDESIYADVARTFLQNGTLSTGIWEQTMPGSEQCACWYPPIFFYALAIWFKIFGFSIYTQRLMSVFLGLCFFALFYLTAHTLRKLQNSSHIHWTPLLALLLVATDINILISTRISRPEILILGILFCSIYFYTLAFSQRTAYTKLYWYMSGFTAGTAVLTHFIALFFLVSLALHFLITAKKRMLFSHIPMYLGMGLITPVLLYIIFRFPTIPITIEQVRLIGKLKDSYVTGLPVTFPYLIYYISTALFTYYTVKNFFTLRENKPIYILIAILIPVSWFFSLGAKMHWYFVYPIAFTYIGMYLLAIELLSYRIHTTISFKHYFVAITITAGILINIFTHLQIISDPSLRASYTKFLTYFDKIEPGKTVFLFSIPDAYYAFTDERKNKIYKFADLPVSTKEYYAVLDKTDYVIFSDWFRNNVRGEMIVEYVKLNTKNVYDIKEPFQYEVTIVELKPRSQRKKPNRI